MKIYKNINKYKTLNRTCISSTVEMKRLKCLPTEIKITPSELIYTQVNSQPTVHLYKY